MTSKEISYGILKAVAILAASSIALLFLYKIATVIIYCIIAIVISLVLNPLVLVLMQKLKFKNTLAVITSILVGFLLISGFISLFEEHFLSKIWILIQF